MAPPASTRISARLKRVQGPSPSRFARAHHVGGTRAHQGYGKSSAASSTARLRTHGTVPPDPAGFFSEGGEVIKLHIEGFLTIPTAGIYGNAN